MHAYDERLTAPRSWWFLAVLTGVACGLIGLPFGAAALLGAFAAGTAVGMVLVSSYGSVRIRVVNGFLAAGDARIPLEALGRAEVLDAAEATAWRLHKADPRAFMLLRSYIPTAVKVEVVDPEDPTPYLYLSTRSPQRLVAALQSVTVR